MNMHCIMNYTVYCPARVYKMFDSVSTLRPRQNERHFADDTLKHIFLNENVRILLKISLKFVPKVRINNIPALVPIMAWRRPGDKPLSEAMMDCLLTHICVTRPQWVRVCWTDVSQAIPISNGQFSVNANPCGIFYKAKFVFKPNGQI